MRQHLWSLAYPALPAARVIRRILSKRMKSKPQERGYVLFDVMYEDGSRASNRRVPVSAVSGREGDEAASVVVGVSGPACGPSDQTYTEQAYEIEAAGAGLCSV